MRLAICDDDKNCLRDVKEHIEFFSKDTGINFEEYSFLTPKDLIASKIIFDIAILDVEMEGINGIKLGEYLRKENPHIILIYLTAHKKYLDDALNLNAVRFFEKPIDSHRFYRGLRDAIDRIDNSIIHFFLKDGKTTDIINAKDIMFIEIDIRKTKIVTLNKTYYSSEHLSFWKNNLRSTVFVIPHRSYIVNMNFITSYKRESIIISNKYDIPISRNKQSYFYKEFARFMEGK